MLIGTVRSLAYIRDFFGIGRHHVPLRILGLALVIRPHGLAIVQDPCLPWAQLVALGRAVRHRDRRRLLALGVEPVVHVGVAADITYRGTLINLREGLVELVAHPLRHGLRVLALVDVDLLVHQRPCERLLACAQYVRAQEDDVGASVWQPALIAGVACKRKDPWYRGDQAAVKWLLNARHVKGIGSQGSLDHGVPLLGGQRDRGRRLGRPVLVVLRI